MLNDMNFVFYNPDDLIIYESMFFHVSMIEKDIFKYVKDAIFVFYDLNLLYINLSQNKNYKFL